MATRPALLLLGFRCIAKHVPRLSALVLAAAIAPAISGQATSYTAAQVIRLRGFGAFSYVQPAYHYADSDPRTNYGVTVGADLDFATRLRIQPGLELRATRSNGYLTTENTYGGGPRVAASIGLIQPYADFLMSGGKIDFHHPVAPQYLEDRSTVFGYGGGVEMSLRPGWAVKVDVQSQRWRLSHLVDPFHPLVVSVGLRYEVGGGKHSPR